MKRVNLIKIVIVSLVIVFSIGIVSVEATTLIKIAYVDMQKALTQSIAGQEAVKLLNEEVAKTRQMLTEKKEEIDKLKEDLDKQLLLLNEETKTIKEEEMRRKIKEHQRLTKDKEEELQRMEASLTQKIQKELMDLVDTIGKEEGYTIILEKNYGGILYAPDKIDLTDKVIKIYNEKKQQ